MICASNKELHKQLNLEPFLRDTLLPLLRRRIPAGRPPGEGVGGRGRAGLSGCEGGEGSHGADCVGLGDLQQLPGCSAGVAGAQDAFTGCTCCCWNTGDLLQKENLCRMHFVALYMIRMDV